LNTRGSGGHGTAEEVEMTKCSTSGSAVVRAHLALILATAWGAWGCDLGRDGNGERVEETRELAAFSRVRSNSELDVQVVQGAEQALSLNLDSNLIDLVRTRVSDDTLYIETREDIGEMVDGPHVQITLPAITAAKLAGSGSMKLAFDEPELPLDLYLSGSGSMRFEGKAAAIGAFLSGSGDIRLAGEASDARLGLSGSGSIDGRHLTTESADIDLSGSGDVSAHAQSSVRVALTGSGNIDIYGGAAVETYDTSGSGEIDVH
jgi:hypothetical protein